MYLQPCVEPSSSQTLELLKDFGIMLSIFFFAESWISSQLA